MRAHLDNDPFLSTIVVIPLKKLPPNNCLDKVIGTASLFLLSGRCYSVWPDDMDMSLIADDGPYRAG